MPVEFLVEHMGSDYPVIAWKEALPEYDADWDPLYIPPDYFVFRVYDADRLDMDNQWFDTALQKRPHFLMEKLTLLERTRINDLTRYGPEARRRKHPFTHERVLKLRKNRYIEPVGSERTAAGIGKTYLVRSRNGLLMAIHSRR